LDAFVNEKSVLREELLRAERKHYGKSLDDEDIDEEISNKYIQDAQAITNNSIAALSDEQRQKMMEQARKLDADEDEDDRNSDGDGSNDEESGDDSSEDDEDDDEDDDAEELLRELEKIKRERAEEKARQEAEAAEEEERQRGEQVLAGNPLLNLGRQHDFTVKRR
jgi:protein CWC15